MVDVRKIGVVVNTVIVAKPQVIVTQDVKKNTEDVIM